MVVYGLAAEYVYDDVQKNGTDEEEASSNHLFIVMKGICFIVFAGVGLFFGWFS